MVLRDAEAAGEADMSRPNGLRQAPDPAVRGGLRAGLARDGRAALAPRSLALRGHLLACASCRHFRRQIGLIRTAGRLRDRSPAGPLPDDDALSDEARRRIARAIDEADRDRP